MGSNKSKTSKNEDSTGTSKMQKDGRFVGFSEFPTVDLLSEAQVVYAATNLHVNRLEGGVPDPLPPPTKKRDVFQPDEFEEIDAHARQTPLSEAVDFHALVAYLTRSARNDVDKIRSFFVWTSSQNYDDVARFSKCDLPRKNSPLWCLLQIYTEKHHFYYDQIFNALCIAAEIPCQYLSGRVKTAHCQPGDAVSTRKSYSAAFVDGAWRFVDQHWGSSFATDVANKDRKLTVNGGDTRSAGQSRTHQNCDDFYFMTDPEMMICTHLPDDPAWQLLARPVTPAEFEQMAYIRDAYFDMGLHSISEPKCVVYTDSGDVTIEIGLPDHAMHTFTYELYKSAWEKTRGGMNGADLNQYVFMDMTKKENKLRLRITFSWIGKYNIKLYGMALGAGFSSELCQCVIHCNKPNFACSPNPLTDRDLWGAGGEAAAVGLVPVNHDGGLIVAEDGQAEIVFKMTHPDDLLFKHSIENDDMAQTVLSNYTVHHVVEDEVHFLTKLPKCGKYIFKLFANRVGAQDDFIHVSNYLIISDTGCVDQRAFPETEDGEIGLLRDSSSVGVTPVSHPNPLITCPDTGYVEIAMSTDCEADVSSQLKRSSKDDTDDVSDYTFIQRDGKEFKLTARFPDVGMYLLTISTRRLEPESEPIDVFRYVINANQTDMQCTAFPKTIEWSNSFTLVEPKSEYLLPNEDMHFNLVVPGATNVYLGKPHEKGLTSTEQDRWEGDLTPCAEGEELTVIGVFPGTERRLVVYKILTADEATMMAEQQDQRMHECEMTQKKEYIREHMEKDAATTRRTREEHDAKTKEDDFEINRALYEEEEASFQEQEEAQRENKRNIERRSTFARQEETYADDTQRTWQKPYADISRNILLNKLKQATHLKELELLKSAIHDCEALGMEQHDDVIKAKKLQHVLEMKTKLQKAVDERDLAAILAATDEMEDLCYDSILQQEMIVARCRAEQLQRLLRLRQAILNMDKGTMSEIRRYDRPPAALHRILQAVFLLLGEDESKMAEWKTCRAFCNPNGQNGLQSKIMKFDTRKVHLELMARSREVLDEYTMTEVQTVSAGAGTFYVWARGVIAEVERQNAGITVKPANIRRQQEILNRLPESPRRHRRRRNPSSTIPSNGASPS